MAQLFFVISSRLLFINTSLISESDFTEITAKDRLNQLMLQSGTGKTSDGALTWLIIKKSRFADPLAVYI
jgi:hypothetical protein